MQTTKNILRIMSLGVLGTSLVLPVHAEVKGPQLYGRWDVSLQKERMTDFTGHTSPFDGSATTNEWNLKSNNSRIGIKGGAPLYSENTRAVYQFEWEIDSIDERSAAGGNTFRTRNSYVGLDTPLGLFFAGTYDSPIKKAEGRFEQFNNTDADISNVVSAQNRYSNSINWVGNPVESVEFRAQILPGESRRATPDRHAIIGASTLPAGTAALAKDEEGLADGISVAALFQKDMFNAAVGWERNSETVTGATIAGLTGVPAYGVAPTGASTFNADVTAWRASVGVEVGPIQMNGMIQRRTMDIGQLSNMYSRGVSGSFDLTARTRIKGQLMESEDPFSGVRNDSRVWRQTTLGADHQLGKSTTAYAFVSAVEVSGRNALRQSDGTEQRFAAVGLLHKF